MGIFKPARALGNKDDDVLCDLDAIIDRKACVVLQGRRHYIEPITTEKFLEFWRALQEFKAKPQEDKDAANRAYLCVVNVVAPSFTLKELERLTLVQKGLLLQSLSAKITGNESLFSAAGEKKNLSRLSV